MRTCLDGYDSRFLLARDAGTCGCRELVDPYCVQTAVAHIGISTEGEKVISMRVQLHSQNISIQKLLDSNQETIKDFEATYLLMPFEPAMDIMFYGTVNSENPLSSNYASTITYDKDTGKMIYLEDVRSADALHVIDDSFRKLHFGHFGGLSSKLIWCIIIR